MRATLDEIAQVFHERYEAAAEGFGYKTREATAVPWEEVPENNKALMIAVVRGVLIERRLIVKGGDADRELERLRALVGDQEVEFDRLRAENEKLRDGIDLVRDLKRFAAGWSPVGRAGGDRMQWSEALARADVFLAAISAPEADSDD